MSPVLPPTELPRRRVLCGLAAVALVPAALAACTPAQQITSTPSPAPSPAPAPTSAPAAAVPGSPSAPAPTSAAPAASPGIAALADVPVGGGIVIDAAGDPLVLVQPRAGVVAGFSAVCPHAGTTVAAPQDGVIVCPNHGSQFAADTGALTKGPATRALTAVPVRVEGDQVVLV